MSILKGGFQDVDRTGVADEFAAYLTHIGGDERVRTLNRRRAEEAGIGHGQRILDVGCGVGFDASLLAELVGPEGRVVGIDASASMVDRAVARLAGSGLPVEFRTADAQALPFDDGSFDAVWTERVLVHVEDPAQLVVARNVREIRHADIGRRVRGLCLEGGAAKVRMRPEIRLLYDLAFADKVLMLQDLLAGLVTEGALAAEQAEAWWAGLEERQRAGRFLAGLPFFVAIAHVGGL